MKKEEAKKLLKNIIVSVLIVCFITNLTFITIEYINSKVSSNYLFTEKYTDEGYIMYLEDIEMWIEMVSKNVMDTTGVNKENYPVTGATVEMLTVLNGTYQMQMLVLSVLVGIIVGVVYYIMKKDYKKIVHYIALFVAMFLLLTMLICLAIMVIDNIGTSTLYARAIGYIDYMDIIETTIIPYTVIYILVCLIVHLINKKRAEKLNEYIK